jgi:hypothetical protein
VNRCSSKAVACDETVAALPIAKCRGEVQMSSLPRNRSMSRAAHLAAPQDVFDDCCATAAIPSGKRTITEQRAAAGEIKVPGSGKLLQVSLTDS